METKVFSNSFRRHENGFESMIADEKYIYIGENGTRGLGRIFLLHTENLETCKILDIKFYGLDQNYSKQPKEIKMSTNENFLIAYVGYIDYVGSFIKYNSVRYVFV